MEVLFDGLDGRTCGEHRTVGYRAWCFDDSEWCYPRDPCHGCVEGQRLVAEDGHCVHSEAYICLACLACPACGCKSSNHYIRFLPPKPGERTVGCTDHPECPGMFEALSKNA